jgi:ribonucleoside-diphosphate reductase alpha chain
MPDRPEALPSTTYRQETPVGTAFIQLGFLNDEPYEVFILVGKCGSEVYVLAEAIARLTSLILQLDELPAPRERLRLVSDQLAGMSSSRGFQRVKSLPDGVAGVFDEYLTSNTNL